MYSSGEVGTQVVPELWACDGPVDASAVVLDAIVNGGRWLALCAARGRIFEVYEIAARVVRAVRTRGATARLEYQASKVGVDIEKQHLDLAL